jgi:valyl-tRNA synthetase
LAEGKSLDLASRWVLSEFYQAVERLEQALDRYNFNEAAGIIYEFFWHTYCDWYLELIKPRIKERPVQIVMFKILEKTVRILHPFMPFITEEIWSKLFPSDESDIGRTSIMAQPFPHIQRQLIDAAADAMMRQIIDTIVAIRIIRSEWNIGPAQGIAVVCVTTDETSSLVLREHVEYIKTLAKVESLTVARDANALSKCATSVVGATVVHVPLEGIIDVEKERLRIQGQLEAHTARFASTSQRLADPQFIANAPSDIVAKERQKCAELADAIERITHNLERLR